MSRIERRWRLGVLAGLVALLTAAIGAGAGQSAPAAQGGTIVAGTTDTVTNIDPAGAYDYGSFTLAQNIYNNLYQALNGVKVVPSLATKCAPVGTVKTWRCTLRRGVKFSDGSGFDSADVKATFDRVIKINDPSGISSLLSSLKSVKTNGQYAVTFNLKAPVSTWPFILATSAGFIVPSTYPADKLQANDQPQIGTGPYTLEKYTPGQQAVLVRNDNYWGQKAKNEGLILRYYSKSSTMKLGLERGEIDMAFQTFTPTELGSLAENKSIKVYQGQGAAIRYIVLNVKRPPFNNVAVRRAMAYLVPRQSIASRVYRGTVKPLYSMPPAGLPGHIDAFASLYGRTPSLAKAKAELQKAGIAMPMPIELWWTPTHYGDASADEYAEIKRGLERGGVFKVTLKSAEWAQYSDALGRNYNAFQLGWFPDYPDPENYVLFPYQAGNSLANDYATPKMTALLKAEQAAKTTAKRINIIKQIQRVAAVDTPVIPVWQGNMIAAARPNVRGIPSTLDAAFIMRFWKLSKS
jgi:peptide/nickel transport system substrate-binding protein